MQSTVGVLKQLRPLVAALVAETMVVAGIESKSERLMYFEGQAARALGMRRDQLREERAGGRIRAFRVQGAVAYAREDLVRYVAEQREKLPA